MNTVRKFKPRSSDTVYLCLLDLYNARVNPSFFESVSQHTIRDCIVENDIPKSHLLYLHNQLVSNSSNAKAQPYVSEEYARDWIYDSNKILRYRESLRDKRLRRTTKPSFSSLNKLLKPLSKPLLELFEEERLHIEGKPIRIEIRGERACDKIYFRASDIQRHLQKHRTASSRNVYGTVVHPNSDYGVNTHYVLLMCEDEHGFAHIDLYLTYFGVVKLLMGTNSRYASSFQSWAIEVLFGSSKTSILQDICNVLKHAVEPVACVYLFRIGTVEEILRFNDRKIEAVNLEGYDQGEIVYKYGVTDNFAQRVKEHARSYARMSANFSIQTFKPVHPSIVEPLKELLGTFFKDEALRIQDVKHTELVVIPTTKMSAVFNMYARC